MQVWAGWDRRNLHDHHRICWKWAKCPGKREFVNLLRSLIPCRIRHQFWMDRSISRRHRAPTENCPMLSWAPVLVPPYKSLSFFNCLIEGTNSFHWHHHNRQATISQCTIYQQFDRTILPHSDTGIRTRELLSSD